MRRRTFLQAGAMAAGAGLRAAPARSARARSIDPPAGAGSGMPCFSSGAGRTLLSWLEPAAGGVHSLRFAEWKGGAWRSPVTVASGTNWFINWADFPSVTATPGGAVFAHWLERMGRGSYGYGIRVARAAETDGPWSQVFTAKPADPEDYSGFLSFALTPSGLAAGYLAAPPGAPPSNHAGHADHRKTLRLARFAWDGSVQSDVELDASVCSCCPTSTIHTDDGIVVAYRDRLDGEIRDISVVRETPRGWSSPERVHADGWKIDGCPTDGPTLTAGSGKVGIAWLTRAGEQPRVYAVLARGGQPFAAPVRADDGNPLGRPAAALHDGALLVAWIEKVANQAELRVKRIGSGAGAPSTVATVPPSRATGFPRIAVADGMLLLAWRDQQVRVAAVDPGNV